MNKKILFTFALTLLSVSFTSASKAKHYGNATISKIISISDGSTFRANIEEYPAIIGNSMSVRINGIETPKLNGECDEEKDLAREAQRFAASYLRDAKEITIRNIKRGEYFKLVADVFVDDEDLGRLLVKNGHAIINRGKTKKDWCPSFF